MFLIIKDSCFSFMTGRYYYYVERLDPLYLVEVEPIARIVR